MPWQMWCPVCGFNYSNTQMKRRWDGVWVCREDWEPRHPQDTIRVRPDNPSVWPVSPEPEPIFLDDSITRWCFGNDPICLGTDKITS